MITQKPESLGSDRPMPPAQIARDTRIGDTVAIPAKIGAKIADVVTSATVVDPWAARSTWLITNAATIMAMPAPSVIPAIPPTSFSPIPVRLMIAPKAPPAPVIARMMPDWVAASVTTSLKESLTYLRREKNAASRPISSAMFLFPIKLKNM